MKTLYNLFTLAIITTNLLFNANLATSQISSTSKLGLDLNIGNSSFSNSLVSAQVKEVVPPISWAHDRRLHENFSFGSEIGFAKYDASASGSALDQLGVGQVSYGIYSGWAALRALIHFPVNEMVEVYGGGAGRYTMVYVSNNSSNFLENFSSSTAKRMDGYGIAGVNLHFGTGFGVFAEGGLFKDGKYFRIGIVLSK